MAFPLYTDEDVRGSLVAALRRRGWDLVRAVDVHPGERDDEFHLREATALNRVLLTSDDDLLSAAARWLHEGRTFQGLIYCSQRRFQAATVGELVSALDSMDPDGLADTVRFL